MRALGLVLLAALLIGLYFVLYISLGVMLAHYPGLQPGPLVLAGIFVLIYAAAVWLTRRKI